MAKMCALFRQKFENLNCVVPECQIKNKVNKERDKPKHGVQGTKVKLMYSHVKESDTSLWRHLTKIHFKPNAN